MTHQTLQPSRDAGAEQLLATALRSAIIRLAPQESGASAHLPIQDSHLNPVTQAIHRIEEALHIIDDPTANVPEITYFIARATDAIDSADRNERYV